MLLQLYCKSLNEPECPVTLPWAVLTVSVSSHPLLTLFLLNHLFSLQFLVLLLYHLSHFVFYCIYIITNFISSTGSKVLWSQGLYFFTLNLFGSVESENKYRCCTRSLKICSGGGGGRLYLATSPTEHTSSFRVCVCVRARARVGVKESV